MAHPISPVLGIISLALSTVARIDLIEAFALVTGYAQNITSSILMIHTDEQRCMPIVFVRGILDLQLSTQIADSARQARRAFWRYFAQYVCMKSRSSYDTYAYVFRLFVT
jgi:hypothetical protein